MFNLTRLLRTIYLWMTSFQIYFNFEVLYLLFLNESFCECVELAREIVTGLRRRRVMSDSSVTLESCVLHRTDLDRLVKSTQRACQFVRHCWLFVSVLVGASRLWLNQRLILSKGRFQRTFYIAKTKFWQAVIKFRVISCSDISVYKNVIR